MSDNKLIIKLGKCFLILTHYHIYELSVLWNMIGMEDNNEIIENQVVKLVCNGFGIDEESISVKLEIK